MRRYLLPILVLALVAGAIPAIAQTKADYRAGRSSVTPGPKAGGNTCANPTPIISVTFIDSGTTVGATSTVNTIPVACNGYYSSVFGPDHIYSFAVGAGNSLTFTLSTTSNTYDPSIYVLQTCGDGNTCMIGADQCVATELGQPSGCPVLSSTESFTAALNPGTYFFYVDSYYSPTNTAGRSAGPYSLTVAGVLPVELLQFEVE